MNPIPENCIAVHVRKDGSVECFCEPPALAPPPTPPAQAVEDGERQARRIALLTGVALLVGLALDGRWTAIPVVALFVAFVWLWSWRDSLRRMERIERQRQLLASRLKPFDPASLFGRS